MTIYPAYHIYNVQLTENVFKRNLFISKLSSAAPIYWAQILNNNEHKTDYK